jgi:uncharacterized phage protein gp47/JayE
MYKGPTASTVLQDLRSSVRAEIPATDPWTWPNNLVPVLKAIAQAFRAAYLRLEFIHRQAFVQYAEGEYLDFHGVQAGGLTREPATYAQGYVTATAILGSAILDGTVLARSDGQYFIVIGTVTAHTTTPRMYVRASMAGELGNTDAAAPLLPTVTVTGFSDFVVATDGLIGGTEDESDDSFRQRILFHKQNPPHGGTPAEYIEWCQTKSGVTRVFVKRATPGPGSVTVYFMMDGIGSGIPSTTDVTELLDILTQLAPSDADVQVKKPIPQVQDVVVHGLVPDTAVMQEAVTEEIKAQFLRRSEPASSIASFTFSKQWLDQAVASAPRYKAASITTPAADVVVSVADHILTLGTVSFT